MRWNTCCAGKLSTEVRDRIEKLLGGFRGHPPADRMALVNFIADFSRFVEGLSDDIVAIDLNPIMVLPKGRGVKIVDAAIEHAAPPKA